MAFPLLLYVSKDAAVGKYNTGSSNVVLNESQKLIGNGCFDSCKFVTEQEGISAVKKRSLIKVHFCVQIQMCVSTAANRIMSLFERAFNGIVERVPKIHERSDTSPKMQPIHEIYSQK